MRRRDLSKALLATAAGSAVVAQRTEAQSCTAPCYAQTAAELAAGVTPVNSVYAPGNVLRYGTNTNSGTTDMTAAIQAAINQHIKAGPSVIIPSGNYLVSGTLNMGNQTTLYSNLQIHGIGFPTIVSNALSGTGLPILTIGGGFNQITGIKFQYSSSPTNTQTNSVAIRCYNLAYSVIDRVYVSYCYSAIDLYQGSVAGTGVNFFFSNTVSNVVIQQYSGWALNILPSP
jgi:hypothetical protein